MSITAEAPNGLRYYLYLGLPAITPVEADPFADDNIPRAMLMLACPWQAHLAPRTNAEEDLLDDNLSHIGMGHVSYGFGTGSVPATSTRELVSSLSYETLVHGELVDTPILFSTDRTTAWRVAVSNAGVFSTVAAPLQVAQFDYIAMFNDYTQVNDILTVNNSGEMSVAVISENELSRNPILFRRGVVYIPDGRFPSPTGAQYPGLY